MDILKVETAIDSKEGAAKLAAHLVEKKLAACVQISGPIESHYRWKKKLQIETEWLLSIKTSVQKYPLLEKELLSRHPYEVPEILAYSVFAGSDDYIGWALAEVR